MTSRIELIENYLNGLLDNDSIIAFEERMKTDPTFNAEVQSTKLFLKELNAFGKRKTIKNQLNEFHSELEETSSLKKAKIFNLKTYFKIISVAASVAIITTIGTFFTVKNWNSSNSESENYRELRMDIAKMKETDNKIWKSIYDDNKIKNPGTFSGTGFAISSNGFLATSYHLIKNADSIFIENETFDRLKVKTIFTDKAKDIAILKVINPDFQNFGKLPYGFNTKVKSLGEHIFTLGFPRENIVYGEGYISSGTGYEGDTSAYQVSIPVNPGNSGGPLIDENGNVVGIVSGKHAVNEGTAFALKSQYLAQIISKLKADGSHIHINFNSKQKKNHSKNTVLVNKFQKLIFRVKVYK